MHGRSHPLLLSAIILATAPSFSPHNSSSPASQYNRPPVPSSASSLHSPLLFVFKRRSVMNRFLYLLAMDHAALLDRCMTHGKLRSHSSHVLLRNRRAELVLQDQRINTVPTLHTPQNCRNTFAGVIQVLAPVVHEQAFATSTGSRRELLALREEPNGLSSPAFRHNAASECSYCLSPSFHDSASRLFGATCPWLQNVTAASAVNEGENSLSSPPCPIQLLCPRLTVRDGFPVPHPFLLRRVHTASL